MESTNFRAKYESLFTQLLSDKIQGRANELLAEKIYTDKNKWLEGLAICDYALKNNLLTDEIKKLYLQLFRKNNNLYYSSDLNAEDYTYWFLLCEEINDAFLRNKFYRAYVERDYMLETARRPYRNRKKEKELLLTGIEYGDAACKAVYGYNLFFGMRDGKEDKEEGMRLIKEAEEARYERVDAYLLNIAYYTETDNNRLLEKIEYHIEKEQEESEKPYHLLAEFYLYKKIDIEKALDALHKGIEVNNPYSMYFFGINILSERLEGYTEEHGVYLLEESYKYGVIYAANWLGRYYYYNHEKKNIKKSIDWHEKAKLYYSEDSIVELALTYLYDEEVKDVEKGNIYLDWAIEEGSSRAMSEKAHHLLGQQDPNIEQAKKLLETAMELGDSYAPYRLAQLYERGYLGDSDHYKVFELCKLSAERGHIYGIELTGHYYRVGITKKEEADPEKAIEYLKQAIDMGSDYAKVELAFCYEAGFGVEQDYKKAYELFLAAAENGYSYAYNKLGYYEEDGFVGEKNNEKAFKYYQKGAEQNNIEAIYNVGRAYKYAIGVPENPKKAVENFQKASEYEYGDAFIELALSYESGYGEIEFDEQKAMDYMLKAAELGYPYAQYKVGCYYYYGFIEENLEEAIKWLELSYEKGYPYAGLFLGDHYLYTSESDSYKAFSYYQMAEKNGVLSEGLGVCYEYGIGVEKNSQEAFKWYKAAAELGSIEGKYRLGLAYQHGIGIEESLSEAFYWFSQAAQENHFYSKYYTAMMLLKGEGTEQNLEEGILLLKQVAEEGNVDAQFELGNCYLSGRGVQEDQEQAIVWYQKAAENGHEQALKITGKGERRRKK